MDFKEVIPLLVAIFNLASAVLAWQRIREERLNARKEQEAVAQGEDEPQSPPSEGATEQAARRQKAIARIRKVRQLNLLLIANLIILPASLGILAWHYWSSPSQPAGVTEVTITYPSDGSAVELREMVRGTVRGVPPDFVVWVSVYPHEVGRHYPHAQPAEVQPNGEWASLTFFGLPSDAGKKFDAEVLLLDQEGQRAFKAYLQRGIATGGELPNGFESLPTGAKIYDRVTVVRK